MPALTVSGGTTTTASTLTPERREAVACVCVPALKASGVTTTTSTLIPERREAVVCVCACINSKWCNNNNIHPDSGKTRGGGVCVPALTASGGTTATTTSTLTLERREAVVLCAYINSKWCNNNNIHPDSGKTRGGDVCVCACINSKWWNNNNNNNNIHPDSGKTRGGDVCVCACINSKWWNNNNNNNNNNIHPDSGKTRGGGVCVPALTASGVTTTSTSQTEPAHHTLKYCLSVYGLIIYLGNLRK